MFPKRSNDTDDYKGLSKKQGSIKGLESIRLDFKLKEFWVTQKTKDAMAKDVANSLNTLSGSTIHYKTLPDNSRPQWVDTLSNLSDSLNGLARFSTSQIMGALDNSINATKDMILEASKVYLMFNPQMHKRNGELTFTGQVMGRIYDVHKASFQTEATKNALEAAWNLMNPKSGKYEMVSFQAKVLTVENPALISEMLYGTKGGLKDMPDFSDLLGTIVKGRDGQLLFVTDARVFAQLAIDNDGDVIQLSVLKKVGESITTSAEFAFYQKSPGLRTNGGVRLLNGLLSQQLSGAAIDAAVTDPVTKRQLELKRLKATTDLTLYARQRFFGAQLDAFGLNTTNTPESPYKGTMDYRYSKSDLLKTGAGLITTGANGRSQFPDIKEIFAFEEGGVKFIGDDALSPQALPSGVRSILRGASRGKEVAFWEGYRGKDLSNKMYAQEYAFGGYAKKQAMKELIPQVRSNKQVGLLTNMVWVKEVSEIMQSMTDKGDLNNMIDQLDTAFLKAVSDHVSSGDIDPKALAKIRESAGMLATITSKLGLGDRRFKVLELQALKAGIGGKAQTIGADASLVWGEEAQRVFTESASLYLTKSKYFSGMSVTQLSEVLEDMMTGNSRYLKSVGPDFITQMTNPFGSVLSSFESGGDGAVTREVKPRESKIRTDYSKAALEKRAQSRPLAHVLDRNGAKKTKGALDYLIEAGILEVHRFDMSAETIGAENLGQLQRMAGQNPVSSVTIVQRDAAGGYRSWGSNPGIQATDTAARQAQLLENSVWRPTVMLANANGLAFDNTTPPEDIIPLFLDPLEAVRKATENVSGIIGLETQQKGGKGVKTHYRFNIGDFSGAAINNDGMPEASGITLKSFKDDEKLLENALRGYSSKKDFDNGDIKKILNLDVESEINRKGLMDYAKNLLNRALNENDKEAEIKFKRLVTGGFMRSYAGQSFERKFNAAVASVAGELAHQTTLTVQPGGGVGLGINQNSDVWSRGSITITNEYGDIVDERDLADGIIIAQKWLNLRIGSKKSGPLNAAARAFLYDPTKPSSVADKRGSKISSQAIAGVEIKATVAYFMPDTFLQEQGDDLTKKIFKGNADEWFEHFYLTLAEDKSGTYEDLSNKQKFQGQGELFLTPAGAAKVKAQQKLKAGKLIEYEGIPPMKDQLSRKAQMFYGKWYYVLSEEELVSDAKLVNTAGWLKAMPIGITTQYTMNPTGGGAKQNIDMMISLGEVFAKSTGINQLLIHHANELGLTSEEVKTKMEKHRANFQKAVSTGDDKALKGHITAMLEDFGLMKEEVEEIDEQGVVRKASAWVFGKRDERGNAALADTTVISLTNVAEHLVARETWDENLQRLVIKGAESTQVMKGGLMSQDVINKIFGDGAVKAFDLFSVLGRDGEEGLIKSFARELNPGVVTLTDNMIAQARQTLQVGFVAVAQQEYTGAAEKATEHLRSQLGLLMDARLEILDAISGGQIIQGLGSIKKETHQLQAIAHSIGLASQAQKLGTIGKELEGKSENMLHYLMKSTPANGKLAIAMAATAATATAFAMRGRVQAKREEARTR